MKVVRVSNYDDEGPRGDQYVKAGPGLSEDEAHRIADEANETAADADYFVVTFDDYVLQRFEP